MYVLSKRHNSTTAVAIMTRICNGGFKGVARGALARLPACHLRKYKRMNVAIDIKTIKQ